MVNSLFVHDFVRSLQQGRSEREICDVGVCIALPSS